MNAAKRSFPFALPSDGWRSPKMPKILIGSSLLLLTLSLLFGFLNTNKIRTLRSELLATTTARDFAEHARLASGQKFKNHGKDLLAAKARAAEADTKAAAATAALSRAQNDKSALEAKLHSSEERIADLQKQVATSSAVALPGAAGNVSPDDLKAKLDETKRQLKAAEEEKTLLADKVQAAEDRVATMEKQKRRKKSAKAVGIHGVVLAVNQAYNFVVLSVGEHQGVEANSELLVMRDGSFIGKLRISSVDPTTSIGDVISNSLARGVQVQAGDTVVYAGNTHS
jgi:hypothetical protein